MNSLKIFISLDFNGNSKKFWVGEKNKLIISNYPVKYNEKINFENSNNKVVLSNGFLLMNSSGKTCLTAFFKKKELSQ